VKTIFIKVPFALRFRDGCGVDNFPTVFTLDQNLAAAAGMTAQELEASTGATMDGFPVTTYGGVTSSSS